MSEIKFKATKTATTIAEDIRYEQTRFDNFIKNCKAKLIKCSNCGFEKVVYNLTDYEPEWLNDFKECPACAEIEVFKTVKSVKGRGVLTI